MNRGSEVDEAEGAEDVFPGFNSILLKTHYYIFHKLRFILYNVVCIERLEHNFYSSQKHFKPVHLKVEFNRSTFNTRRVL